MERMLLLFIGVCAMVIHTTAFAQGKIVTTGNNLLNTVDPCSADIVIESNQSVGIRHNASILWWSGTSASRISNTLDFLYIAQWSATISNIGLSVVFGGISYNLGNVGMGTYPLHVAVPSVPLTDVLMEKWNANG